MKRISNHLLCILLAAGVMLCIMPALGQYAYADEGISEITVYMSPDADGDYHFYDVASGFAKYLNGSDGIADCNAQASRDTVTLSYKTEEATVSGVQYVLSQKLIAYMNDGKGLDDLDYVADIVKLHYPALGQKPISQYSDDGEINNEIHNTHPAALGDTLVFFALWDKEISYIELELAVPAIGTEVTVDGTKQTPEPEVTVKVADAALEDEDDEEGEMPTSITISKKYWAKERTTSGNNLYEGELNGNALAGIELNAGFGYYLHFGDSIIQGIYVNGELISEGDYYYKDSAVARSFWYEMTNSDVTVDLGSGHEGLAAKWAEYLSSGESGVLNYDAAAKGSKMNVKLIHKKDGRLLDAKNELADSLTEFLEEKGYMDNNERMYTYRLAEKPGDKYKSVNEINAEYVDKDKLPEKLTLYAVWFNKPVSSVRLSALRPVCGMEADDDPVVTVAYGQHTAVDFTAGWFDDNGKVKDPFKGGQKYRAFAFLDAKYGYYFTNDVKVILTNGTLADNDRYPYVEPDGVSLTIYCDVTAVHDPDKLVKTAKKKATLTEDGNIEYYTCACGGYCSDPEGANDISRAQTVIPKNNMTVTAGKKLFKARAWKKTTLKAKNVYKVENAKGAMTYKLVKKDKRAGKKITVASNGNIKIKRGLKKGKTYTITVRATSAETSDYAEASTDVKIKIKIK